MTGEIGSTSSLKNIRIRPYRHSDGDQVRKLFSASIVSTSVGSPLRAAIWTQSKDKKSILLFTIWVVSLYLQVRSKAGERVMPYLGRGLLIAAMVAFCYRMYQLHSAFLKFIDRAITTDLFDIAKSYGMVEKEKTERAGDLSPAGTNGFWIAELYDEDGQSQIVGCTGLDISTYPDPNVAELRRMAVSSICRRQGIAGKLIRVALDHARKHNLESIFLTTCTYNTSAIGLYQKFGWVIQDEFTLLKKIRASQLKLELGVSVVSH